MIKYQAKKYYKGINLSLKENIKSVKEEIGAEEQFLESIIKGERFYKKYKRQIQVLVVVAVLAALGYVGFDIIKNRNLRLSNEAYEQLSKNPNNQEALAILKDKNINLYNVYIFKEAIKTNNVEKLKEISNNSNKILADISKYQVEQIENSKTVNSELLKGFSLLEEGFDLLKENKITEAKLKFAQIDPNSPLFKIAKNLEHYQGKIK